MITEFKLPALGENIVSGTISKIPVKVGDTVKKDQIVLELETDKATIEVPSSVAGIVKEILIKVGDQAKVGQLMMKIEAGTAAPSAPAPSSTVPAKPAKEEKPATSDQRPATKIQEPTQPAQQTQRTQQPAKDVPAAPSVRRFAREIGINIEDIPGTGPSGRISLDDVKTYAKQLMSGASSGGGVATVQAQPLPDFSRWGEIERKAMNNIRKKTAEHLSYAWTTIPHVTQFDKADITDLEKLRKRYSTPERKLTITPFLLKVIASALKTFPQFNTSIDMKTHEIIYKKFYHIAVAVDTDRGLLVPVIRDVDKKSIFELTKELNEMAERARNKKTTIEEMQGGCFTLTNLGGIGGTHFTPIVNWPDVAILGTSRAQWEPVFTDAGKGGHETFVPRLMLPLSLSYDHRVIDGADGARFLRWIAEAIQQPFLMELSN